MSHTGKTERELCTAITAHLSAWAAAGKRGKEKKEKGNEGPSKKLASPPLPYRTREGGKKRKGKREASLLTWFSLGLSDTSTDPYDRRRSGRGEGGEKGGGYKDRDGIQM